MLQKPEPTRTHFGLEHCRSSRTAVTVAEVVACLAILSILAVIVGSFSVQSNRFFAKLSLARDSKLALANAREEIGSWSYERVTAEEISKLDLTNEVATAGIETKLVSTVTEMESPLVAKKVFLHLEVTRDGEKLASPILVFWIGKPQGSISTTGGAQ